jgi:hypothetical protein
MLDESRRFLLRQRRRGAVLLVAQARMDQPRKLREPGSGTPECVQVHPNILQYRALASDARLILGYRRGETLTVLSHLFGDSK